MKQLIGQQKWSTWALMICNLQTKLGSILEQILGHIYLNPASPTTISTLKTCVGIELFLKNRHVVCHPKSTKSHAQCVLINSEGTHLFLIHLIFTRFLKNILALVTNYLLNFEEIFIEITEKQQYRISEWAEFQVGPQEVSFSFPWTNFKG